MAIIGITGGTGLVGSHISDLLTTNGHNVIILSRNPDGKKATKVMSYALFDAENERCDSMAMASLDAVIHLAGESLVAHRWTTAQKQKIVDSRVKGTKFLTTMLRLHGTQCKTFIGASAIGYYGEDSVPPIPFTEDMTPATDFLATTCVQWEAAEQNIADKMRVVISRTGVVLAKGGGALKEYTRTAGLKVLPVPGNGRQIVSWIHVEDLARLLVYALETSDMVGAYNAVAPAPVSCGELMNTIANEKGGIFLKPHIPSFAIRTALGGLAIEVLKSATVSAERVSTAGFTFSYPTIKEAIHDLLGTS